MACALVLALGLAVAPALAGGGSGGDGGSGGGDGGTGYGGKGIDSVVGGGGGGGGGYYGGDGGRSFGCPDMSCLETGAQYDVARGGIGGGRLGNTDGTDGESGDGAGGGGGGGAHGFVDPLAAPLPTTLTRGGNGGHGGAGGRAGGGGGGAGDGALLYGTDYTLSVDLVGGRGGNGGNGGDYGGMAGSGGHGLTLNRSGANITIQSTVTGGDGGHGGTGATRGGNGGAAGAGVVLGGAYGGTVVVQGTIVGGNGGAGGANGGWDSGGGYGIAARQSGTIVVGSTVRGGNGGGSAGGGAAIYGGDVTVTLGSTARIEGGLSGDGSSRAASLVMNGRLNIDAGARLIGDIYADGARLSINPSTSFTLDQAIRGSGVVAKIGSGTLILSGVNDYVGATQISQGTLALSGAGTIARSDSVEIDGTLDISATTSGATIREIYGSDGVPMGEIRLGAKTLTVIQDRSFRFNDYVFGTFGGVISGSGGLVKQGSGTLTLTGNNAYSGVTRIDQGTLALADAGAIAASRGVIVNSALDISGLSSGGTTIESLTGSAPGTVHLGGKSLTVRQSVDTTFAGRITGSGSLVKSGSGTLTLTGASDYSGGTTIQAGALKVASNGASGTGFIAIEGGALLDLAADSLVLANAIRLSGDAAIFIGAGRTGTLSGSLGDGLSVGSLSKTGGGALVLTGESSYSGATLIQEGTLMLSGSGSIAGSDGITVNATLDISGISPTLASVGTLAGSDAGIINLGTKTLMVTQTADAAFAGRITGAGSLAKAEAGRLMLSGANDYSGGTRVLAGTVAVASNTALGTGTIAMDDGTALEFATSDLSLANAIELSGTARINIDAGRATLAGSIDDGGKTGTLVKTGDGTLILTAAASHSGGTLIAAGRLVGTSSSLAGDIVNEAALVFDQAADGTYSGTIAGSGSLTKSGTGSLVLTADNSYAGATVIEAGSLQVGDGGWTGSISGNVVNNGTLVFDRKGTYALPELMTGPGFLVLRGGGTALFAGTAEAGGTTIVGSGLVLAPRSRLSSDVMVDSGGMISGTGTINGLFVRNGGLVSPGHSPGTLSVAGDVAFASGSTYVVDGAPSGEHDLLAAEGRAALSGGTVQAIAGEGKYAPKTVYTILSADGGVAGEFTSVTTNLAFLDPVLSYDANNVYLTLKRNSWAFEDVVFPTEQKVVADAAERLGLGNPVYDAILQLTAAQAPAAFDALSGEIHASASGVMVEHSTYLRDAVTQRLRQAFANDPVGATGGAASAPLVTGSAATLWTRAYGGRSENEGAGRARVTSEARGLFAGLDVPLAESYRLGIVGGYGRSTLEADALDSSGSLDRVDLGVYGAASLGALDLLAGAAYGWNDVSIDRTIEFPGFMEHGSARYRAAARQVFGEASYRFDLRTAGSGKAAIEPFAGLAYVDLDADVFREDGSSAALTGSADDYRSLSSMLGVRFTSSLDLANGGRLDPYLSAGWQHGFGDTVPGASLAFASGGTVFSVSGTPLARDMALVEAGFDYELGRTVSAGLSYKGRFASGAAENSFWGALSVRF
ncbi:MAG TPA: autotransporter-associated beta strand repeat-containing protein [Rhizobiaceae bacterium]|nr:autotransporter-associated beta strand repeat-containing protein [Rhizobiaceae bacterium]